MAIKAIAIRFEAEIPYVRASNCYKRNCTGERAESRKCNCFLGNYRNEAFPHNPAEEHRLGSKPA